jgi:hypothetical protein
LRNVPASESELEREISVRSRSKNAAPARVAYERTVSGLRIEPARDRDDRLRESRDRRAASDSGHRSATGHPSSAASRSSGSSGIRGEQRHADLIRERLTPTRAEQLLARADEVGHVLDRADDAHPGLLRHLRRTHGDLLRRRLRRRDDERLGAREELPE